MSEGNIGWSELHLFCSPNVFLQSQSQKDNLIMICSTLSTKATKARFN